MNRPLPPTLLALSALLLASPSPAQESELLPTISLPERRPEVETKVETDDDIETIVVVGEKLGRTLAETATSTGVATRDRIEAGSDASMKDAITQFANVVSSGGDREIAIRGVPQNGVGGEGQTVSVYLDGVPLPSRAASFAGPLSAWDLEQIEVLRGSQSTNQGRNSLAGSVVIRTRAPTDAWDLRARAGVMSRDGHDYAIAAGGPMGGGFGFRASYQDRFDNRDVHNVTRDEDDAQREMTRNGRFKLAFKPTAAPGYSASLSLITADNEFGDTFHEISNGERTQTSDVRHVDDMQTDLASLEQTLLLGEHWTLESITGATRQRGDIVIDYDRSADEGGYSTNVADEDAIGQELRLRWKSARLSAVAGAYYEDADRYANTVGYDVATAGGAALLDGVIESKGGVKTAALFAEADWEFIDSLRLTLGLRYNDERSRRDDYSELSLTLAVPELIPGVDLPVGVPLPDEITDALAEALPDYIPPDYDTPESRRRFKDVLPKAGLTWFITPEHALGLTYQEGYRSGGTSVSFFGGAVSEFDPEYTQNYELSARTRWFERRLNLNANVFYTRWKDMQVTVGDTDQASFYTTTENAGRSHLYGLELEAGAVIAGPFDAFASIGLLQTQFDEFSNQDESFDGNEFPAAPHETATIGITMQPWHRLSGQASVTYVGQTYSDPSNTDEVRVPSRTLVNAKLAYAFPAGFSLAFYGRNLTNDLNEQGRLTVGDRVAKRYGEPRSFGAVLEWQL
jgi:outer membrane receptor protein involved in Fe transport